jgi:hypothetical protein
MPAVQAAAALFEKHSFRRQYGVKGLRPLAGRGAAPHKKGYKRKLQKHLTKRLIHHKEDRGEFFEASKGILAAS